MGGIDDVRKQEEEGPTDIPQDGEAQEEPMEELDTTEEHADDAAWDAAAEKLLELDEVLSVDWGENAFGQDSLRLTLSDGAVVEVAAAKVATSEGPAESPDHVDAVLTLRIDVPGGDGS